jgi:hypothetical protein
MSAHRFLVIVLVNIWFGVGLVNAARITLTSTGQDEFFPTKFCEPKIQFDGEIKAGDLEVLKSLVDQTCNKVKNNKYGHIKYELVLNSDGGDVSAALSIGRFIRNLTFPIKTVYFKVSVWARHQCNSSCVFLIAAGQSRHVVGKVGIHRPYLTQINSNLSAADIGRIRTGQIRLMRAYLAEMDVPESLLDAMLSIPPEEMKILSESELKQYRIYHDDANFEEKKTAEGAKEWYLTSAEYRKRDAERIKNCGYYWRAKDDEQYSVCEITTMLNISKSEAQKRLAKIPSICGDLENEDARRCVYKIRAGK